MINAQIVLIDSFCAHLFSYSVNLDAVYLPGDYDLLSKNNSCLVSCLTLELIHRHQKSPGITSLPNSLRCRPGQIYPHFMYTTSCVKTPLPRLHFSDVMKLRRVVRVEITELLKHLQMKA